MFKEYYDSKTYFPTFEFPEFSFYYLKQYFIYWFILEGWQKWSFERNKGPDQICLEQIDLFH